MNSSDRKARIVNNARLLTGVLAVMFSLAGLVLPQVTLGQIVPEERSPCCWDMWDPGWIQRDRWGPGHMGPRQRQRMLRHWTFMHEGVPAAYRGQTSTIVTNDVTVEDGAGLYAEYCASCHGTNGQGDGEEGKSLTPSPALLAHMIRMPMAVDEYLLWTISEGGTQFQTDMPAFKDKLKADEIWKIIAFMRAGFPEVTEDNKQ